MLAGYPHLPGVMALLLAGYVEARGNKFIECGCDKPTAFVTVLLVSSLFIAFNANLFTPHDHLPTKRTHQRNISTAIAQ